MTKAARIRELDDGTRTVKEIASIVAEEFGRCLEEYVRVAARQRANGVSDADRRYIASPHGQKIYRRHLTAVSAYLKTLDTTGNRVAARKAGRKAYAEVRKQGSTKLEANSAYRSAYSRTLRESGNKTLASSVYKTEYAHA